MSNTLDDVEIGLHESEYQQIGGELQEAQDASHLSESPNNEAQAASHDVLVRVMLANRPSELEDKAVHATTHAFTTLRSLPRNHPLEHIRLQHHQQTHENCQREAVPEHGT